MDFPEPDCSAFSPLHAVTAARLTQQGNHLRTLFITLPFRLGANSDHRPHHPETSIGPLKVSCARIAGAVLPVFSGFPRG